MNCFIFGNKLCIVDDDFVSLQESEAVFIPLTKKEIGEINAKEKN